MRLQPNAPAAWAAQLIPVTGEQHIPTAATTTNLIPLCTSRRKSWPRSSSLAPAIHVDTSELLISHVSHLTPAWYTGMHAE